MKNQLLFSALMLAIPAFASSWQTTYFNTRAGTLMIDKDSIIDTKNQTRKFWTLYAPRIVMGQPGPSYAYNKVQREISCGNRTSSIQNAIYYDEDNTPHDSTVEDKSMHDIEPDGENDYLWQYICKPERQNDLAHSANRITDFINDQVKFTRENNRSINAQK